MDALKILTIGNSFTDSLTRMFGKNEPSLPPPAADSHKEE